MRLARLILLALGAVIVGVAVALLFTKRDLGQKAVDASIRQRFPDVPRLTTAALAQRLAQGQRPVLVDVRAPDEFAVSHLAGARRVDPKADADALAGLPRDTAIVVYCSVGWRSAAFAEKLRAAGFTRVENLEGSIFAWANEGRSVVRDGQAVQVVHPYDGVWGRLLREDLHATAPPQ